MHFSRPVSRFPVTLISLVRCSAAPDCSFCSCGCCSIRPSPARWRRLRGVLPVADRAVLRKQRVPFSGRGEAVLRRLKKLDHSMIYVLIAGSYTPIILKFMPAPRSYIFLGVIWLIALTGIASSCCGLTRRVSSAPRCTSRSAGRLHLISGLCCPCPRLPLPCWLPEVCRIRSAA